MKGGRDLLSESEGRRDPRADADRVGQLFDYGRFAEAKTRTVLVPTKPRPDLLAYLAALDVHVVCPADIGWERVTP